MKAFFKTQILSDAYQTAEKLAKDFIRYTEEMLRYRDNLYIALSGGSTPQLMFEIIANEYKNALAWNRLHFFWVDERCVLSDDAESNYGNAYRLLFSKVKIPAGNIHFIHGGNDPLNEAVRYSGEILSFVPCVNNTPAFDLIFLGMGNDGHTASIFPGQTELFDCQAICAISQHPQTCQKRITLTGKVINNASLVVFLVTGSNKADKVKAIINSESISLLYPAKRIKPSNGALSWYLDKEAANFLDLDKLTI
ncbi:MAG: 6-phosphogluconolactonase [Bacteroidota bacterium]|nr:6-phosphogluconolactonase [Bacteroidota bacterium]